jgi:prepilin-type N-terminal cleavage/methylation domain-containing protein
MEMKRKQKHISLRFSNKGFTIVELLVAMVVSLLAMAAIYSTFLSQHRSYQIQNETSDMQQNIRAAMYHMEREIRMAGSNPFNSLPSSSFGITAAGQTSITFTEDVTGPPAGIPQAPKPDGIVNDPTIIPNIANEDITYALNGTNLERTDNSLNNGFGDTQVVAQNIDWIDFVYLDGNSPPQVIPFVSGSVLPANLSLIRSVEITIVARTNDPLLYGATNNRVYPNQQPSLPEKASFGPAGDNVSRRSLTTKIYCRNLGL